MICSWSRRILSPIGKITVIKTVMLPRLTHLFIALPNPDKAITKDLETAFFKFIWNDKTYKISRNQLYRNYEQGGLKMINIQAFIKSMKITWIKRLPYDDSTLTLLFEKILNSKKEYLFKLGPDFTQTIADRTQNVFWKDVLMSLH